MVLSTKNRLKIAILATALGMLSSRAGAVVSYSSTTIDGSADLSDQAQALTVMNIGGVDKIIMTGGIMESSGGRNLWLGRFAADLTLENSVTYSSGTSNSYGDIGYGITSNQASGDIYVTGQAGDD